MLHHHELTARCTLQVLSCRESLPGAPELVPGPARAYLGIPTIVVAIAGALGRDARIRVVVPRPRHISVHSSARSVMAPSSVNPKKRRNKKDAAPVAAAAAPRPKAAAPPVMMIRICLWVGVLLFLTIGRRKTLRVEDGGIATATLKQSKSFRSYVAGVFGWSDGSSVGDDDVPASNPPPEEASPDAAAAESASDEFREV